MKKNKDEVGVTYGSKPNGAEMDSLYFCRKDCLSSSLERDCLSRLCVFGVSYHFWGMNYESCRQFF
jgi:hypothetical protein